MNNDLRTLAESNKKKAIDALRLLKASLDKLPAYDLSRIQSADDQEPYDALSDRFMRAVEICLKFFRSYERYMYGEMSENLRDLLNRMEKVELISGVQFWMEMRDLRNRIVHDYLPGRVEEMYSLMMEKYGSELEKTLGRIEEIDL